MSTLSPSWRRRLRRAVTAATGVALAAGVSVVVADPGSAQEAAVIRTLAGNKVEATPARLAAPRTVAVDNAGNIFFTDTDNHMIRRLDPQGAVTNIAGTGSEGQGPDGVPATDSAIWRPHGVAVDNRGHVFIADSPNHRIRRVDLSTGIIDTVAGTGTAGFAGDGGPATAARLDRPRFLIVDPDGSLVIADTANRRVRRVDPSGVISTIAGTGETAYSGDGGPATAAALDDPRGLARDAAGNLYVSNAEGSPVPAVRRIDRSGTITTVAGGNPVGYGGDGGPATEARLNEPRSIAVSGRSLYIADSRNHRIRRVDLDSGTITTVAGTGSGGFSGDGGAPTGARLAEPRGIGIGPDGTIVVADTGNNRIRAFSPGGDGGPPPPPPAGAELNGHVVDALGAPAGESRVDVSGADGEVITSLPTAGDGRFALGLEDGVYRLAGRAVHGCAPLRSPDFTVEVTGGQARPSTAELRLQPGPGGSDVDPLTARVEVPRPGEVARASVESPAGEVTLEFEGLTRAGEVSVACRSALPGPGTGPYSWLDTGVALGGNVRFSAVTVCLPYSQAQIAARTGLDAASAEARIDLVRLPGAEPLPTSRHPDRNVVCGRSSELGELALGIAEVPVDGGGVDGSAATPRPVGYRMVATDGGIFSFGDARFFGSTGGVKLNRPIVGMAPTPSGAGYWLVATDGGIFSFGDAAFLGSTGNLRLNKPIVGMAATRSGRGYWLVASDGGIFSFGDAAFLGSTGAVTLNQPIVGMAPTRSGRGYRLVATDGGIFSFGDAAFLGSTGGTPLSRPIAGMAPTPTGAGYWLVATDGGIFSFGDAPFLGSTAATIGTRTVSGMVPTASGQGYWLGTTDGRVFAFGDAPNLGSVNTRLNQPIVALAPAAG